MDKIILGLLIIESCTVYEMKTKIEQNMNKMYSGSFGSIQTAIKKLLDSGFVEFSEAVKNGKYKKIYSVTAAGEEEFGKWINTPMHPAQGKNQELAKLYFMGLSDRKTRRDRIESYLAALWKEYFAIKARCGSASGNADDGGISRFMNLSDKYTVDSLAFEIEWFEGLLADIE